MAVLLLRYAGQDSCLQRAWVGPLIASWVIAACLLFSWVRAARSGGGEEAEEDEIPASETS
jgi:hypothetical protein